LVILGRISAPYGVKGWVRVHPFTELVGNLLDYRSWWLGEGGQWREREVVEGRVHGAAVVARLLNCADRDAAERLRGKDVAVPRSVLPDTRDDEFYWADLIGLKAVNVAGEDLGEIVQILQTGANDVLVVRGGSERLIPFIATVVREVDLAQGVVRVDWDADF
jgi:16S rRNA processing protein RimM